MPSACQPQPPLTLNGHQTVHCGNSFYAGFNPIEVLDGAAKMPSLELEGRHEAARVHHTSRQCGG
jgi:hypothetical protein